MSQEGLSYIQDMNKQERFTALRDLHDGWDVRNNDGLADALKSLRYFQVMSATPEGREVLFQLKDDHGHVPLANTIWKDNLKGAKTILEYKEGRDSLNSRDEGGWSPLMTAVYHSGPDSDIVKLLEKNGAATLTEKEVAQIAIAERQMNPKNHFVADYARTHSIHVPSESVFKASDDIMAALEKNNAEGNLALKNIINTPEGAAALSVPRFNGEYPILSAARSGNAEAVNLILSKREGRETIDFKQPDVPLNPMMLAVANGHENVAKILAKNGAAPLTQTDVDVIEKSVGQKPGYQGTPTCRDPYLTNVQMYINKHPELNLQLQDQSYVERAKNKEKFAEEESRKELGNKSTKEKGTEMATNAVALVISPTQLADIRTAQSRTV